MPKYLFKVINNTYAARHVSSRLKQWGSQSNSISNRCVFRPRGSLDVVHTLNPSTEETVKHSSECESCLHRAPSQPETHSETLCQKHTHQNCKDIYSKLSAGDELIYDNVKY